MADETQQQELDAKFTDWRAHDWNDVDPVPLDDGGEGALGKINYSDEYREATALLRAVMSAHEYSVRALALTAAVIDMNTAHYTAWEYRLRIVREIGKTQIPKSEWLVDGCPELGQWLDDVTLSNPKGYQVWNYREYLEVPDSKAFYVNERNLCAIVIEDDSKNFHAWSHLKWTVSRGSQFFDAADLLAFTASRITEDVRNNSAWGFRYFLYSTYPATLDLEHETKYAGECIEMAPQNESVWSYLEGLYRAQGHDLTELETLCREYAPESGPLRSTHAAELLVQILSSKNAAAAGGLLDQLAAVEPIRSGYWESLRQKLVV